MEGVTSIKLYDNRTPATVIDSEPTSVKLKEYTSLWFSTPITSHYILIESKEGYTLRLNLTEELYNTLSDTKIDGED